MKRSTKQIAGNGGNTSCFQEDIYIYINDFLSSSVPSSQTTRMGGLYILNRTKSYQICDADQVGTDTLFLRKHTKLFPKLEPKIPEPTTQHESEIPCIHEDHFFKGKAFLLKNNGMILPSKKISDLKGGKPLVASISWRQVGLMPFCESMMALAVVPFSIVTLTALVVHSVSKGYNWNLTQKPFPNTASLGWQQELIASFPCKHQRVCVENTPWASIPGH